MDNIITHTSRLMVAEKDTAVALGSGDMPVLATPALVALMENAAMLAIADDLDEGFTTVGGYISVKHLRPSLVGATVEATATLEKREGTKLQFLITAMQDGVIVGEATHTRFIVSHSNFMNKI